MVDRNTIILCKAYRILNYVKLVCVTEYVVRVSEVIWGFVYRQACNDCIVEYSMVQYTVFKLKIAA